MQILSTLRSGMESLLQTQGAADTIVPHQAEMRIARATPHTVKDSPKRGQLPQDSVVWMSLITLIFAILVASVVSLDWFHLVPHTSPSSLESPMFP